MTLGSPDRPLSVLLVEDNPGDARLAQEALGAAESSVEVSLVEDGEAALAYLRSEGEYAESPKPDLVLLDIKLPKKDGFEVLAEIGEDEVLSAIPVLVLTGTEAERSMLQTYNIPPSRYFTKPISAARFDNAVGMLPTFSREPIKVPGVGPRATVAGPERRRWWWPFGGS